MKAFILKHSIILLAGLIIGCDEPFSYSIYDAKVPPPYRGISSAKLAEIGSQDVSAGDLYRVAIISDVHIFYDELQAAIQSINNDPLVKFVIVDGDVTNQGLMREYIIFADLMQELSPPYLTVIGNHDYLANGRIIYPQIYAEPNKSFSFNGVKFVLFDDVIWESETLPDFKWLENEIDAAMESNVVILAHISWSSDQFDERSRSVFQHLAGSRKVQLLIHGHDHHFAYEEDQKRLFVPSLNKRSYCILEFNSLSTKVLLKHF